MAYQPGIYGDQLQEYLVRDLGCQEYHDLKPVWEAQQGRWSESRYRHFGMARYTIASSLVAAEWASCQLSQTSYRILDRLPILVHLQEAIVSTVTALDALANCFHIAVWDTRLGARKTFEGFTTAAVQNRQWSRANLDVGTNARLAGATDIADLGQMALTAGWQDFYATRNRMVHECVTFLLFDPDSSLCYLLKADTSLYDAQIELWLHNPHIDPGLVWPVHVGNWLSTHRTGLFGVVREGLQRLACLLPSTDV